MLPPPTARLTFREWGPDDQPLARAVFGDARVTACGYAVEAYRLDATDARPAPPTR